MLKKIMTKLRTLGLSRSEAREAEVISARVEAARWREIAEAREAEVATMKAAHDQKIAAYADAMIAVRAARVEAARWRKNAEAKEAEVISARVEAARWREIAEARETEVATMKAAHEQKIAAYAVGMISVSAEAARWRETAGGLLAKIAAIEEKIAPGKAADAVGAKPYVPLSAAEREATRKVVGEALPVRTANLPPRYVPKIGGNSKTDKYILDLVIKYAAEREAYSKSAKGIEKAKAKAAKNSTAYKPIPTGYVFGAIAARVHSEMNLGKIPKHIQWDAIAGAIDRKVISELTRPGLRLYFDAHLRPQPQNYGDLTFEDRNEIELAFAEADHEQFAGHGRAEVRESTGLVQ
jgi:hypothetical protein